MASSALAVAAVVLRRGSLPAVVTLALAALALGYRRLRLTRNVWRSISILAKQVPGPEQTQGLYDVFVDVTTNHRDRINDYLVDCIAKYGPTFHVAHYLIVTRPDCVQYILKDNFDNYTKGEQFLNIFHDLMGDGIFNTNGENWRVQRKTASKMFSRKAFTTFMSETFLHHGHTVLDIVGQAADGGAELDLQEIFYRFTLDSIGQIGFGVDLGVLRKGGIPFSVAFDKSQAHLFSRFLSPLWSFFALFSAEEWAQKARIRLMTDFIQKIIEERRREGQRDQMDILSFFMERTDENGKPFTEKYLQDIVMNFIIAGRDTTAVTLSWTFATLSANPDIEQKLLEEIDSVLHGREPTYDDVDTRLPYLHAVVKEVLRLYPPVPKDIKMAQKDDTLPDGTFVPAGTGVVYFPYGMARMEQYYENPLKFDPERWFQPENAKKTPFEFPVFQAGPRICLGMSMAYFEAKLLTAMILQKFVVRVRPGARLFPAESLTMPIAAGLPVTIQRRTPGATCHSK